MKRGGKSVGRPMKPTPFPELEKPIEEFKSARRMYGFHKNMNSPGFYLGSSQGPRRYLTKAIRELKKKQVNLVQEHIHSLSPQRHPVVIEESTQAFATRDTESSPFRGSRESPKPRFSVLRSIGESPKVHLSSTLPNQAGLTPTASIPMEVPIARRSVEPRYIERDLSASPVSVPRRISPISSEQRAPVLPVQELLAKYAAAPKKEGTMVHELAALPCFQAPRITRQSPKLRLTNPITGLAQKLTSETPDNKRGLGSYGALLMNNSSGM